MRKLVNHLQDICSNDLQGAISAYLPIITRSPLNGDYDLDLLKQTIGD